MWKRLIHPNVVPFVGVTTRPPQIASEWMPRGNLTTYANSSPDRDRVYLVSLLSLPNTLSQLSSVGRRCKGPRLHPLSRCDSWRSEGGERSQIPLASGSLMVIPQPNILVDGSGHARITDFGLAQSSLGVVSKPERQSMRWTAPEVLAETGAPSTEADVFSFGMIMVEVCSNSTTVRPPKVNRFFTLSLAQGLYRHGSVQRPYSPGSGNSHNKWEAPPTAYALGFDRWVVGIDESMLGPGPVQPPANVGGAAHFEPPHPRKYAS